MKNKYLIMAMAIAPFTFVGCNGGGDSGVSSGSGTPSGVVFGRIDGFGSIHVDNRRLITDDNTLVIIGDDNPVIWDDSMIDNSVRAGQIARVQEDNGHADRIFIDENVKGPVDSTSPDLVVMGQTVVVGAGTVIDNNCPDFSLADVVEVYGLPDETGAIQANIIECKTSADVNNYSVIGVVSGLSGNIFQINGLTVDFTNAIIDDDLPGGPQDGMLVQVKDDQKIYTAGSGTLFATKVEPQASASELASTNQHLEIESFVTDASGLPDSFVMGDLTINISASTTFLFGDVSLIANGVKLEAEGHINASGELNADKIKFEDSDSRVDALVSSVDTVAGTITLLDGSVTVSVDDSTDMRDGITPQTIVAGDSLEVRGFLGSNGDFIASEVRTGSGNTDRAELRSTASQLDAAAGTMVIMGITIHTNGSEFKDHDDNLVSKDAFFATLVEGVTTVQVRWQPYNGDVTADVKELELEDD